MLSQRQKFLLLAFDLIVVMSALCLFFAWRMEQSPFFLLNTSVGFWFVSLSALTLQYIVGLYDIQFKNVYRALLQRSLAALILLASFVLIVSYLMAKERTGLFGRGVLLPSILMFQILVVFSRIFLVHFFEKKLARITTWILGFEEFKPILEKDMMNSPQLRQQQWVSLQDWRALIAKIENQIRNSQLVLAAPSGQLNTDLAQELLALKMRGLPILTMVDFYESQLRRIPVNFVEPSWFLDTGGFGFYLDAIGRRMKRLMDLAISSVILLLTFPLILIAAIITRLESSGDIFYSQIRTGQFSKPFRIYKLRTMYSDAERQGPQWAKAKDNRVTLFGRFFRMTRIDELPQIYNIFKGEMSFVGPRPERPEFDRLLAEQIPFYELRYSVPPGLTGWAQVHYPYGASIEDSRQKLQYDLYYIKNFNIWMDITIVLKTLAVVFGGRGR